MGCALRCAVVLAVVYLAARKAQLSLSVIGVGVDFLQVVSLFSSFGFAWPEELTSLFKAASASTVNEQLVGGPWTPLVCFRRSPE